MLIHSRMNSIVISSNEEAHESADQLLEVIQSVEFCSMQSSLVVCIFP